jgi:glycerate kinase
VKILIAPNALKGSLDAFDAARAIAEGLARAMPRATLVELPVADGGDGTAKVLVQARGGEMKEAVVCGPRGDAVRASFGLIAELDGVRTAVVEIASAVGLALVVPAQRDPMRASSYGAGELVRRALDEGCRRIVIGLGGSATVDGGAGLVQALGVRLLDARGREIERGGGALSELDRIDVSAVDPRISAAELLVLCDVDNPLLGERGAARVFGPQKGATPEHVEQLESNLARWAACIRRDIGRDVGSLPHGGAAGGMAAGIYGVLDGTLVAGAEAVLTLVHFDERLEGSGLVVTAEGHLDVQTLGHKAPWAVAERARRKQIPVAIFVGGMSDGAKPFAIFDAIVGLCPRPMSLEEAMTHAKPLLSAAAEQVGRLLCLGARTAGIPAANS